MNPETAMSGKWLEILKDTVPSLNHVLVMVNAGNEGNAARLRGIEAVAPSVGVRVSSYAIREEADIESAIKLVAGQPNVGIIAAPASPINELRKSIFALAERHRLPAVYAYRYYAVDGGLMSYGAEPIRMWRQTATYVDRILRGAKPADLPVQGPATFQLVLNLKAARAISLTIPDRVRALADEVIE
jgi:putative ABC transport system substrate-binding protein